MSATTWSVFFAWRNDGSRRVVAGEDHGPFGDGAPEHARAGGELDGTDEAAAPWAPDPGVVREAQLPGRRIHEVDHRAVGIEQAGRPRRPRRSAGRGWIPRRRPGRRAPVAGRVQRRRRASTSTRAALRRRLGDGRRRGIARAGRARLARSVGCGHGARIRRARRGRASPFAEVAYVIRPSGTWTGGGPPVGSSVRSVRRPLSGAVRLAAGATVRTARRQLARRQTPHEVPHRDVRFPNAPPRRRRRHPRRHRRARPVHRLHPLDARWPAVHPERRRATSRPPSRWSSRWPSPSASAGSSASASSATR